MENVDTNVASQVFEHHANISIPTRLEKKKNSKRKTINEWQEAKKKCLDKAVGKYLFKTIPGTNLCQFRMEKPLFDDQESLEEACLGYLENMCFSQRLPDSTYIFRMNFRLEQKEPNKLMAISVEEMTKLTHPGLALLMQEKLTEAQTHFPSLKLDGPKVKFNVHKAKLDGNLVGSYNLQLPPRCTFSSDSKAFMELMGFDEDSPFLETSRIDYEANGKIVGNVPIWSIYNKGAETKSFQSPLLLEAEEKTESEWSELVGAEGLEHVSMILKYDDFTFTYDTELYYKSTPFKILTGANFQRCITDALKELSEEDWIGEVGHLSVTKQASPHMISFAMVAKQSIVGAMLHVDFDSVTNKLLNLDKPLAVDLDVVVQNFLLNVRQPYSQSNPFKNMYPLIIGLSHGHSSRHFIGQGYKSVLGVLNGPGGNITSSGELFEGNKRTIVLDFTDFKDDKIIFQKDYTGFILMSFTRL